MVFLHILFLANDYHFRNYIPTRSQTGYLPISSLNAKSHWSFVALKSNQGRAPPPILTGCRTCGVVSSEGPWTYPTIEMIKAILLGLFSSNVVFMSSQFVLRYHRKMHQVASRRPGGLRMLKLFELGNWKVNRSIELCSLSKFDKHTHGVIVSFLTTFIQQFYPLFFFPFMPQSYLHCYDSRTPWLQSDKGMTLILSPQP